MPRPEALRVQLVSAGGRDEALRGAISLLVVGAVIGLQWWAHTPEAERMARLQRLGISRCAAGRWHARGIPLRWPPSHCECFWTEPATPKAQALADSAERGQTK